MTELWKKILTNNHRFTAKHPEYRRVYLLNIVLVVLLGTCLFFSITNFWFFELYAAVVNFIAAILSLLTLYYFHKTDNIRIVTYAVVVILLGTLSAFFSIVEHRYYALYWISPFPAVVYFLLGRKKARIVIAAFSMYLLYFILTRYSGWEPAEFNIKSIFNIAIASLVIFMLVSYIELIRNEVAQFLEYKNIELEEANYALEMSREQLRLILDSTAEAIYGIDIEGNCTFCNTSCIEMLGYKNQDELLGENMHLKIHHSHKDGTLLPKEECQIFKTFITGESAYVDDEVLWRADGTSFDAEYYSHLQYKDGKIVGAVVNFMDTTQRKSNEAQIKYLSSHDSLTGLYNRSSFENALRKLDREENLPISTIYGDVNGLKLTNDIFGHQAGDALLKKVAEILKKACRDGDIIARMGGDEFIILLPKTQASDSDKIVSRVKTDLSKEKIAAIKCSVSMGRDTKTCIDQEIESTVKNAENEMYKEKILSRTAVNSDMINTIITTLHDRSPREKQHSIAVSKLCRNIGKAMNLPETEIKKLKEIGFLHDIGKIVLSDDILRKESFLEEKEEKEMQQHSVVGYRILNIFDDTLDIAEGVYSHHESWDGTGYPKGLKGEEIPRLARILAVAQAYEAMINIFNKNAKSKEAAILEIKNLAGKKYDPDIVNVFIDSVLGKI